MVSTVKMLVEIFQNILKHQELETLCLLSKFPILGNVHSRLKVNYIKNFEY